ncbi:hypothetical protein QAD02_011272 [Eretmocerus hayati]|uniref:Uncharacterized protein n=1 Tax=Eretmocerus hayati TaxID=131215 RepID=A0ACC2NWH5_9HYME|nr:hypothetical protein QAD02_011272 [Eretmocerus hayati]
MDPEESRYQPVHRDQSVTLYDIDKMESENFYLSLLAKNRVYRGSPRCRSYRPSLAFGLGSEYGGTLCRDDSMDPEKLRFQPVRRDQRVPLYGTDEMKSENPYLSSLAKIRVYRESPCHQSYTLP